MRRPLSAGATALLLVLTCTCAQSSATVGPSGPDGVGAVPSPDSDGNATRVLFVGNSYLYTMDIPAIVQSMADSAGDAKLTVRTVAGPDMALIDHWNAGVVRDVVANGKWDWVVLQQGPSSTEVNRDSLRLVVSLFAAAVERAGGRTALFSAWPAASRRVDYPRAIESYELAAADVGALLVPVARAWMTAWDGDPSVALYVDGLHPSTSGAYLSALVTYARLLGRSPRGVPSSLRLRSGVTVAVSAQTAAALQEVAATVVGSGPLQRSSRLRELPDSTFWPEGVDYDPRSRAFYVGSVRHRTIARVDSAGVTRNIWPVDRRDVGAVMGVRVDPTRDALWATSSALPQMSGYAGADSGLNALLRIRLSDGVIERRWLVPAAPRGHVLGDLAVGPSGDVYVTDSREPFIYMVRSGVDTLARITDPLFRSLQGVVPTPDGKALYVADYARGILRVDLANMSVVRVGGPEGGTTAGCDGMVWYRGSLIAVQNGVSPARVVRLVLDPPGTGIARIDVLDRNVAEAPEPTIGTLVGDRFVYVANSQWDEHDDAGRQLAKTRLTRPRLLALPLPR